MVLCTPWGVHTLLWRLLFKWTIVISVFVLPLSSLKKRFMLLWFVMCLRPPFVEKTCGLFSLLLWLVQLLWCSLSVTLKTFYCYDDCSVNLRVGYTWHHQVIALVRKAEVPSLLCIWVFKKVSPELFYFPLTCGSPCLGNWLLLSLQYAGPAITAQMIRSVEMELTEVLAEVLGNCSAEEFYAIMRLVLQGLEVKNVWQQKAKVRLNILSTSFCGLLYLEKKLIGWMTFVKYFFLLPALCSLVRSN